ncbi:hypothetical protein NC652_018847 [Populus alba x Populus x berolinensis]|nr:hypothetical protein NC652_018847 [Populus alba x Populus x berolinensis]
MERLCTYMLTVTDDEGCSMYIKSLRQSLPLRLLQTVILRHAQPPASKGPYSQVGFSYERDGKRGNNTFFQMVMTVKVKMKMNDDDEDLNSDDSE